MENLNGALGFKATLDIDDFNVSAASMEKHIRQVSNTTMHEAAAMEDSIQGFAEQAGRYISSYLVGMGMKSLLQSIVTTRGQFQQLEIAFETMLGSASKSKVLMDQLIDTAAKTPFDLMGVAGGAKQLMAYGESADKVNDTLVRLGNIASGLSIPLNDIVYLYGTTMVQGRLYAQDVRQFTGRGIPLVKELANMYHVNTDEINRMVSAGEIGFPQVQKVINKLTNEGGQFYQLMETQSKSLTGMISNLGDAWDSALNSMGKEHQDMFAGVIGGAITVVENFDEILRIVKAITIAYGSYKAAIALNTLATKGYTGVALIDNTVRQAKISLLKLDALASGQVAKQTQLMTAADQAHTASLHAQLTAEELVNLQKKLRIGTIASLLTAQQQEYLSNMGLTTSSQGYEAAALGVMTVDQQQALAKTDLSAKSQIYKAALAQEVMAKQQNRAATLGMMREDVKAAAAKLEGAKQAAVASMQRSEAARLDLYWAKQSGDAARILAAQKRLEAAQDTEVLARKTALAVQTDFYAKKKLLESTATRQSTIASAQDTAAKGAQATATTVLSTVTSTATMAMRTLWTAMKQNPIGWIMTAIGLLISAFSLFSKKEEEATDANKEFTDTTRGELDSLDMLYRVLSQATTGTNTHKKAIEKINSICRTYNTTLLEENDTLTQQKKKYEELQRAIKDTTAEKVKAKYIEKATIDMQEAHKDSLDTLKDVAGSDYFNYYDSRIGESLAMQNSSIKQASDAVWDLIEASVADGYEALKDLSGEEYEQGFETLLHQVMNKIKVATNASDNEIMAFSTHVRAYMRDFMAASKDAAAEIDKVTKQTDRLLSDEAKAKKNAPKKAVDYLSMSFKELDELVEQTQKSIDEINKKEVKTESDNKSLIDLLATLKSVNATLNTKTSDLNTEAGISDRIKTLKDERANVEINSAKYKAYTEQIDALTSKLPKRKGGKSASELKDDYMEMQTEANKEVRKAEIESIEDDHERKMALLDFQHQENLDKITKQEKELIEAKGKAHQGELSDDEKKSFQSQRDAENQTYTKAKTKAFDEEIAYKKQQYALYYRWVQNMGKDVADQQFAKLLENGNSFSSWINEQIKNLENKKNSTPDAFNEGDHENLFSLRLQQDEILGKRTAMDYFRESINRTIGQAATLAEKVNAIAEAKEKLARGDFKLSPDQKLEAQNTLDDEERGVQNEVNQKILNDFKDYEQKKNEIAAEYNLLRMTEQAQSNKELLDKINEGEAQALSTLNAEQLKASADWQQLFTQLDYLSAGEIQKLIDRIQEQMNNSQLNLAPADFQALMESLDRAKQKITSLNPFKALGGAFDRYIATTKRLRNAEKNNLSDEEINNLKDEVRAAAADMTRNMGAIIQITDVVGNALSGLADSFGNDELAQTIGNVTGVLTGAGQAAMGVGQIMSGDVLGGIQGVVSGISQVVGIFNKMHDAKNEKRIKKMQQQIDKLAISYEDLGIAMEHAFSTEKAAIIEQQNKNLEKQNQLIRKQIEEEKAKKETDWDRIKDWEDQIRENEREIEQNRKYAMIEAIMGTDIASAIDQFAEAYADAWTSGEKAAKRSAETVKGLIKTAIIEQLKNKLKPEVEAFMTAMSSALEDGIIDKGEEAMIEHYQKILEETADGYLSKNEKWLKDEETDDDPLSGAIRSLSEETGGVIAGRMNTAIIHQSEQAALMRENLSYSAQIAQNTYVSSKELGEIKETLKRIETKDNSLLSQGIE